MTCRKLRPTEQLLSTAGPVTDTQLFCIEQHSVREMYGACHGGTNIEGSIVTTGEVYTKTNVRKEYGGRGCILVVGHCAQTDCPE
jgi:hypothetical protein